MMTLALILAAVAVLGLFCFAVHLMVEDGLTACWFFMCGVPQGLCRVLGLLVAAIFESIGSSD